MHVMFNGCPSLASLDLSGWNTEKVKSMDCMFRGCSSLASIGDLSGWNTEKVSNMGQMFRGCSSLTSLDLSSWNTGNVWNMGRMFYGCSQLASLDLSGWDTGSVTDMGGMFDGCTSVEALAIGASTALAALPPSSVNGIGYWYSTNDSCWYAEAEIIPGRLGTADTYTTRAGIAGAEVAGIADRVYTGEAQVQSPTVKLGAETLVKDVDYELSYEGNVGAGTATVTITGIGRYKGATSRTFEIAKANQTISAADAGKVYGDAAFALGATTSGDGELSYSSSDAGVAAVDGSGNVTIKGAGTAAITVSAAATGNCYAASRTVTVTVAKAGQAISASDVGKVYGDAAFALGARLTKGEGKLSYASSNSGVAAVDAYGKVTIKGAGTAKITVTAAATANYKAASKAVTVTVDKAANPLKLAKATRTVKAKNVEKKNIVVRGAKLVKAGQGTMTYSIKPIAKKYKKFKKYVGINKKTGKIAIMKGCPKGTFTMTVKATAKGNANYKSAARTAVVTIRVK
ncbi:MAG: BspA family leucine-rich repeat surface protein [Eggerthellaceae bacterium]|nr:BspA family leucine-rich repeat surface protein [Eggerthellaceae bacterium]